MHEIVRRVLSVMIESENIMGIVVADKDGVIKSVSRTNGSLPLSLIGTK